MLDQGVDPWDAKIFHRLREVEKGSSKRRPSSEVKEKRPALEVVQLWLKIVAFKFPNCVTEAACDVTSSFVG